MYEQAGSARDAGAGYPRGGMVLASPGYLEGAAGADAKNVLALKKEWDM